MASIGEAGHPPPKTWDEFERLLLAAVRLRFASESFQPQARKGERQDGVDLQGTDGQGRRIGIQARHTFAGMNDTTIREEVARAESVSPALTQLYIATAAKRDASLLAATRLLSRHRAADRKFTVDILFWEDIARALATQAPAASAAPARPDTRHDTGMFAALMGLLPPDGVIAFIDQTNMAGASFPRSRLDPLTAFLRDWNKRERVFRDAEIEAAKRRLWEKVQEYLHAIASETVRDADRFSVPEEWETQQPERFWRVAKKLNRLAEEIVELHRTLARIAGQKLGG